MGRPRRVECRTCGRHIDECGPLSARGLCEDCSVNRVVENNTQMVLRKGPYYDQWAAAVLKVAEPFIQRLLEEDEER